MKLHIVQTVGGAICTALPRGANTEFFVKSVLPDAEPDRNQKYLWLVVPEMPTDLFAVCGHLCRIGGVVGFFDPSPYATDGKDFQFVFTRTFRDYVDEVAWHWRGGRRGGNPQDPRSYEVRPADKPSPPNEAQELWKILLAAWDEPINCGYYVHTKGEIEPPAWWRAALALLMISE